MVSDAYDALVHSAVQRDLADESEFIGVQKLLRPDVYLRGTPPCPQQPSGDYFYVPGIDRWACFRPT